ncbi:MAG: sialate O-acetylesterase [Pseudomonadota bacterium]
MLSFLSGVGRAALPLTPFIPTPVTSFDFTSALPAEFTYTGNSGNGTYRDNSGTIQRSTNNQPRFDHDENGNARGILFEETRTNKCTNTNFNPSDTSNMIVSGGTLSIAFDATLGRNVFQFENTSGSAQYVQVSGQTGNANAHSLSVYMKKTSGGTSGNCAQLSLHSLGGRTSVPASTENWERIKLENITATGSSQHMRLYVFNGYTIQFELNSLEEAAWASSPIVTDGASATRTIDNLVDTSIASRDYFNESAGAITAQVKHINALDDAEHYIFSLSKNTGFNQDSMELYMLDSRSKIRPRAYANGVAELNEDIGGYFTGAFLGYGISWGNNVTALTGSGYHKTDTLANTLSGINRFWIGNRSGNKSLNGWIKNLTFHQTERTAAQLGQTAHTASHFIIGGGQSNFDGYEDDQTESKNSGQKILNEQYQSYRTGNVVVANGSTAGSRLIDNDGTGWYNPNTQVYGDAYNYWKAVRDGFTGTCEAILFDQGESDVAESKADYKTALLTVLTQLRNDCGGTVPVIIIPIGGRSDSEQNGYQNIREAQQELASENSWIHLAPEKFDQELEASGTHLTDTGYQANAPRVIRKTIDVLGETVSGGVDGPTITNAIRSGTTVTVTLSHDSGADFMPSSGIEGFVFLDGITEIAITSAIRTNATTITLTLASSPSGTETLYYGYRSLFGINRANLVKDNSAEALPLRSTKIIL